MKADKWFSKEPTIVNFDDKFQHYQKMTEDIEKMPLTKNQECITLHMSSLQFAVKNHVVQWINIYGKILHTSASTSLFSLFEEMQVSNILRGVMVGNIRYCMFSVGFSNYY